MDMKEKNGKKAYEKPVFETVPLKADEIMAAGCKTGGSPPKPNVPPPCGLMQCVAPGS